MKPDTNQRHDMILDQIVRSYIDTAEPVGSRTISRHFDSGLSPASIRNVMADLEEEGYLKQPHTSAGRVPTDKGYRYWVDSLMEPEAISDQDKDRILSELAKARTVEALAARICKVISEMTGNAVLVYIKNLKRVSFLNHLLDELVQTQKLMDYFGEEPELFIDGTSLIFEQPEFQDLAKMRMLLQAFDQKISFLDALLRETEGEVEHDVQVRIGHENEMISLGDVSLVAKDCFWSDAPIGGVAVVGPTRMKYWRVVSLVDYVADTVSESVRRF